MVFLLHAHLHCWTVNDLFIEAWAARCTVSKKVNDGQIDFYCAKIHIVFKENISRDRGRKYNKMTDDFR